MLDISTLTDEQLLQLTAAWDEPDYLNTCEDCGREYELRPNMASGRGRWCPECGAKHKAGEFETYRAKAMPYYCQRGHIAQRSGGRGGCG